MHYQQALLILIVSLSFSLPATAFDSGSTGSDGVLNVTEDTELQLPPSGIFNYTDVTIAEGATLTFGKNAANTPVTILASRDVLINGTIDVSGSGGQGNGTAGVGGPGGFEGGSGGLLNSGQNRGGDGLGPGGGLGHISNGGNGSFSFGPRAYGNIELLPLIGGSGGGGGGASGSSPGGGGGGGGGAILIAASGTVTVNGSLLSNGGKGGDSIRDGGQGSGGGIRIVATTLTSEGDIIATGRGANSAVHHGRIRLEAEVFNRVARTTPDLASGTPGILFIPELPTLRISNVGGVAAPTVTDGFRDVILPGITINPVAVIFATSKVPAGNTIELTATPEHSSAAVVVVTSEPIAADGSATASINLQSGNSSLTAEVVFEVEGSMDTGAIGIGETYAPYAGGEAVQRVRLNVDASGQGTTTLTTVSGKTYTVPASPVAMH